MGVEYGAGRATEVGPAIRVCVADSERAAADVYAPEVRPSENAYAAFRRCGRVGVPGVSGISSSRCCCPSLRPCAGRRCGGGWLAPRDGWRPRPPPDCLAPWLVLREREEADGSLRMGLARFGSMAAPVLREATTEMGAAR